MNGPSIIDAISFATKVVTEHLELRPGEEVVMIADSYTDRRMLDALAGAIAGAGGEYTIVIQPARTRPEEIQKLTRSALRAYEGADVIIPATGSCGVSQYAASSTIWPLLAAKKARVFTLSERSVEEMTEGAAAADYHEVERTNLKFIAALEGADRIRISTKLGTNLELSIRDRVLDSLASFARKPGDEGGIPSGEICTAPVVGSASGVAVIDGPIGYIGALSKPIRLTAREGKWIDVEGDTPEAEKLRHYLETLENARNVAEFAIGTNPLARKNGVYSEEKKRLGTMHSAFGRSNKTGDWECEVPSPIHGDLVIYSPTIEVDGRLVFQDGQFIGK